MLRIEKAVQAQFAQAASRPTNPEPATQTTPSSSGTSQPATTTSFAKVNSVVAGSPAEDSGLRAQDLITRFGSATWLNHDKLSKVAEVVSQNEGVSWLACMDDSEYTKSSYRDRFQYRSCVVQNHWTSCLHHGVTGAAEGCLDVIYYLYRHDSPEFRRMYIASAL
jgi:hypothetical protein